MSAQERPTDDEDAKPLQSDNYDRDSLEEFVAKEAEVTEEAEKSTANTYIDIDGKWKLELEDNGLEEETNDHEERGKEDEEEEEGQYEESSKINPEEEEEEEYEVKWCTPVGVRSDESSSEDEKGPSFGTNQPADHKFSDGIVWETIEECDEEETESECCVQPGIKVQEEAAQKAVDPPTCQEVIQQQPVKGLRMGVFAQPVVPERMEGWEGGGASSQLAGLQGLRTGSPSSSANQPFNCTLNPSNQRVKKEDMRPEEYEAMHEEVGNISVRNLATFWEDLTRRVVGEEAQPAESSNIKKKWNSMPELKGQIVKRRLPETTRQQKVSKMEDPEDEEPLQYKETEVVKSDFVVDDVELCRSVSIKDRREMFESLEKQSRREMKKQWSSMPSLKHERRLPSPEKGRVSWQDEKEVEMRERSPVKEVKKTLQELTQSQVLPPVTPLVVTNVVSSPGREELNSSSDSLNSSLTSSSTVIPSTNQAWELASLQEDSAGEIYTGPPQPGQDFHLFVVENGTEVPLTPLSQRKSLFERAGSEGRRGWEGSQQTRSWEKPAVVERWKAEEKKKSSESLPTELVRSSSRTYIEEEHDVLQNINVVGRVKMRFLDS